MADQLICYTAFEIDGASASSRGDVVAKMVFFLRGQGLDRRRQDLVAGIRRAQEVEVEDRQSCLSLVD